MKQNYTKGPWKVINATFGWKGSQPRICNECEDTKVAELPALSNSSGAVNLRAEEIAANAQLIAAAPELAEALEWLIPYLEFRSEQSGICLDDGIKVAKKAWAKAVAKTLEKTLEKAGPLPA